MWLCSAGGGPKIVLILSFLLTCSEILIYLSLFTYLDQHNKDMVRILTEQVLKQRRKVNVLELRCVRSLPYYSYFENPLMLLRNFQNTK